MSVILLPDRWQRQPQYRAGLDSRFNPVAYWNLLPPVVYDLQRKYDLALQGDASARGGHFQPTPGAQWGFNGDASALYAEKTLSPTIDPGVNVLAATVMVKSAAPGAAGAFLSLGDSTNAAGGIFVIIGQSATTGKMQYQCRWNNGASATLIECDHSPLAGDIVSVVGITTAQTVHKLYVNGYKFTDSTDLGAITAGEHYGFMDIGALNRAGTVSNYSDAYILQAWYDNVDLGDSFYLDWTLNPWQYFKPRTHRLYFLPSSISLTSYYLGTDITVSGWTTSTGTGSLASMVDETSRDDTDYIQSAVNPVSDVAEIQFANVQTPSTNTNHTVSYVIKGDSGPTVGVSLIAGDGATIVKSWSHTAGTSFSRFDQTLSTTEANSWAAAGYPGSRLRITAG